MLLAILFVELCTLLLIKNECMVLLRCMDGGIFGFFVLIAIVQSIINANSKAKWTKKIYSRFINDNIFNVMCKYTSINMLFK